MKKAILLTLNLVALLLIFERSGVSQSKPSASRPAARIIAIKAVEIQEFTYDAGTIKFLAPADATGGAWSLVEVKELPGYKTNLHRHHVTDEAFYVLEGVLSVNIDGKTSDYPAGSYVFIPRGTPHAQGNLGKLPVRLLLTMTPSGFEQSFKDRIELFKTIKPTDPEFRSKRDELTRKGNIDVERLGSWETHK